MTSSHDYSSLPLDLHIVPDDAPLLPPPDDKEIIVIPHSPKKTSEPIFIDLTLDDEIPNEKGKTVRIPDTPKPIMRKNSCNLNLFSQF